MFVASSFHTHTQYHGHHQQPIRLRCSAPINEIIDTGSLPFIPPELPADLEVMDRLKGCGEHIGDEMHRVEQLFTRDVDLEWVGQPVAIDDITTPVEG